MVYNFFSKYAFFQGKKMNFSSIYRSILAICLSSIIVTLMGCGGGSGNGNEKGDTNNRPSSLSLEELDSVEHSKHAVQGLQYTEMLVVLSNYVISLGLSAESYSGDNTSSLNNFTHSFSETISKPYRTIVSGIMGVEVVTWERNPGTFKSSFIVSLTDLDYEFTDNFNAIVNGVFAFEYEGTALKSITNLEVNSDIEIYNIDYVDVLSAVSLNKVVSYADFNYTIDMSMSLNSDQLDSPIYISTNIPLEGGLRQWPNRGEVLATGYYNDVKLMPISSEEDLAFSVEFDVDDQFISTNEKLDWKPISNMAMLWDRRFNSTSIVTSGSDRGGVYLTIHPTDENRNTARDTYGTGNSVRIEHPGYSNLVEVGESYIYYSNFQIDPSSVPNSITAFPSDINSHLVDDESIDYNEEAEFLLEATDGTVSITPSMGVQINVSYRIEFEYRSIDSKIIVFDSPNTLVVPVGQALQIYNENL